MTLQRFFKTNANNFTPQSRTPWAGGRIAEIKSRHGHKNIPAKIGESWEVSTDRAFPSLVSSARAPLGAALLSNAITTNPVEILGPKTFGRFGAHMPILLKWIEAASPLSVQIHPHHGNAFLKKDECGKPEAWLVIATKPGAGLYVGFQEGVTKKDLETLLRSNNPEQYLNRIEPKPFEFISIPPGCVHALGANILIVEPQIVLHEKEGKTWRISDWGRRYNAQGEEDSSGLPRELHTEFAQSAIDWSLPQGGEVSRSLSRLITHGVRFLGNTTNPFGTQVFLEPGTFSRNQLFSGEFELVTVWNGKVTLQCSESKQTCELSGGESAVVSACVSQMAICAERFQNKHPEFAFFSLNPELSAWHS